MTLYVDTRGLSTGPMPADDGRSVEIAFDILDHRLALSASDGRRESFALADFYAQLFVALDRFGVAVQIDPAPFGLDGPLLSADRDHRAYDADAVARCWTILRRSGQVLEEFAGWFSGKQSPVHLFWHSFDVALARFSGRPAARRAGADPVTAEAYSHEVIAFGFWPGDDQVRYPAYYSYTAPAPDGLADQPLEPAGAGWLPGQGAAHLPYDDVRTAADPRATLLRFFASAYEAGARAAGWDVDALAIRAAPRR